MFFFQKKFWKFNFFKNKTGLHKHRKIKKYSPGWLDGLMNSKATFKDCQCSKILFFVIKRHSEERNTTLIFDPINFCSFEKIDSSEINDTNGLVTKNICVWMILNWSFSQLDLHTGCQLLILKDNNNLYVKELHVWVFYNIN